MAEAETLSHSGICVHDLKEAEDFYCGVLGARLQGAVNFFTEDTLNGRSVHQAYALGDFLFAVALVLCGGADDENIDGLSGDAERARSVLGRVCPGPGPRDTGDEVGGRGDLRVPALSRWWIRRGNGRRPSLGRDRVLGSCRPDIRRESLVDGSVGFAGVLPADGFPQRGRDELCKS